MGCLLLQTENRGTIVPTGTLDAYQLPRTTCRNSGNQNLCKVQDCYIHFIENRQHNSGSLHQQPASRELVMLTRDPWMWLLERNIHIAAMHLPGVLNTITNIESWEMLDRTDWKLNPVIFQKINNLYGPLDMDLLASKLSTQFPLYFSWQPDPYALATHAFPQS